MSRRFVTHPCPNKSLPDEHPNRCTEFFNSMEIIGSNGVTDTLICNECGTTTERQKPAVICKSQRYPYINESIGDEVLTSLDHERHVAKEKGMVERDYGRVKIPKKTFKNKK